MNPIRVRTSLLFSVLVGTGSPALAQVDPCQWPGFSCNVCRTTSDDGLTASNWPLSGQAGVADKLTEAFGPRDRDNGAPLDWDYHEGVDMRAPDGTNVHSPWTGWVVEKDEADGKIFLQHDETANALTRYTGYLHLKLDAAYRGLEIGERVEVGTVFAHSADTGATNNFHLHFLTMIGGPDSFRKGVNPMRMNDLPYAKTDKPKVTLERFFVENNQTKFSFIVSSKADLTANCHTQEGCRDQLHFNRLRIKEPDWRRKGANADAIVIDFDRRINDDSQYVLGSGGPGRVGNEDGLVTTRTQAGWDNLHDPGLDTEIRIEPLYFTASADDQQRVRFTVTVPERWKGTYPDKSGWLRSYQELIEVVACDTWAPPELDCSEHCSTLDRPDLTFRQPPAPRPGELYTQVPPGDVAVTIETNDKDGFDQTALQVEVVDQTSGAVLQQLILQTWTGTSLHPLYVWHFLWQGAQPGCYQLRATVKDRSFSKATETRFVTVNPNSQAPLGKGAATGRAAAVAPPPSPPLCGAPVGIGYPSPGATLPLNEEVIVEVRTVFGAENVRLEVDGVEQELVGQVLSDYRFRWAGPSLEGRAYALQAFASLSGIDVASGEVQVTGSRDWVKITSPANGALVKAGETVGVLVETAQTAPVTLDVKKGGLVLQTLSPSNGSSPWRIDWRVPDSSQAESYVLQAHANVRGQTVDSAEIAVTATPNQGRVVTIIQPPNGYQIPPDTDLPVTVSAPAQESVYLVFNNTGSSRFMTETSAGLYTYTIPKADVRDGANTIDAGVIGYVEHHVITVFGTAVIPPPALYAPTVVYAHSRVSVSVLAPSATAVTLEVSGSPLPLKERSGALWRFEWTPLSVGTYSLLAEARYDGKPPRTAARSITVSAPPPMRITPINQHSFLGRIEGIRSQGVDDPVDVSLGVPAATHTCGIVGYAARGGDIDESSNYASNDNEHIIQVYPYIAGDFWSIRTGFRTGFYDPVNIEIDLIKYKHEGGYKPRPETWDIDVLCVSRDVAQVRTFSNLGQDVYKDTGILIDQEACVVAGFDSGSGDINEKDVRDIIQVYPYREGGTWRIRSLFATHKDHDRGPDKKQNWTVSLLCLNRSVASLDAPAPEKPFFVQEFRGPGHRGFGDNVTAFTPVPVKDYVCGVGGFAARDGNIAEGDFNNTQVPLMLAHMTDKSGYWHFRGDFRSEGNHENWDNVNVLCALRDGGTPPAWNISRLEAGIDSCMGDSYQCQVLRQESIRSHGLVYLVGGGLSGRPTGQGLRCAGPEYVEVYINDRDPGSGRPQWSWPARCLRSGEGMALKSEFTYDFRGVSLTGATTLPFELVGDGAPVMQGAVAQSFPPPYGPGIALTWMPTSLPGAKYYEIQYSTDKNTWSVYTRERDISWGGWINHHGNLEFGPYKYALPSGQTYFYRVRVLDASQSAISGFSNVISGTVERWNKAPTIEMIPTVTVRSGELLIVDVKATDPEGRHLEIRASNLPSGSGFYRAGRGDGPVEGMGSAHGEFIWGPEDADTGTHFVWFIARDEFGEESMAMLQIVVCDRNANVCGFF